jgi:hypothetical protein
MYSCPQRPQLGGWRQLDVDLDQGSRNQRVPPITRAPAAQGGTLIGILSCCGRGCLSLSREQLSYRFTSVEDGKTIRRYSTGACQSCALKAQCTTGLPHERPVHRWYNRSEWQRRRRHQLRIEPCAASASRPAVSRRRRSQTTSSRIAAITNSSVAALAVRRVPRCARRAQSRAGAPALFRPRRWHAPPIRAIHGTFHRRNSRGKIEPWPWSSFGLWLHRADRACTVAFHPAQ